jgi:hypothetical protein
MLTMRRARMAIVLVVLAAAGLVTLATLKRLVAEVPSGGAISASPAAGLRAQRQLAELVMRQAGVSDRTEPVVVPAEELEALLVRHLVVERMPLRPIGLRLDAGWLEIDARTTLRAVLAQSRRDEIARLLPDLVLDRIVWISARGRVEVSAGRAALMVERVVIGRQPVPPSWLWWLLDVAPEERLRWRVLPVVERVEIQPGRLLIHTRTRLRGLREPQAAGISADGSA